MSISEENPLKVGDKVLLTGEGWGEFQGKAIEVDSIAWGQPWSDVTGIGSIAFSESAIYRDGYEVKRFEGSDSDLTLPEKAAKIVENLTSVGFTREQACEIAMLEVRKEAQNV